MSEKMAVLRCKTEVLVDAPAVVTLSGNTLTWDVGYTVEKGWVEVEAAGDGREGARPRGIMPRDVKGCLQEFVSLADDYPRPRSVGATDALARFSKRLLTFVQKRGVLGIDPKVTEAWRSANGGRYTLHYEESVFVYAELARTSENILTVMEALRKGTGVRKTEAADCLPSRLWSPLNGDWRPSEEAYDNAGAYRLLMHAVSQWWEASTMKIGLSPPKQGSGSAAITPDFLLSFGQWNEAFAWDRQRQQESPLAVLTEEASRGVKRYDRLDPGNGAAHYRASLFPRPGQRASPLFNVLVFQLLQAVTFPEGTYICDQCGSPFTPRGNAPRSDKATICPRPECKKKRKSDLDRERYHRKPKP